MDRDVGNALAVDIDFASIPQALHILRPGIGPALIGDDIFRTHMTVPQLDLPA